MTAEMTSQSKQTLQPYQLELGGLPSHEYIYTPQSLEEFIKQRVGPIHRRTFEILTSLALPVALLHGYLKENFYPRMRRRTNISIEDAAEDDPRLLNPYTVVKEGANRRLEAVPFNEHPELVPLLTHCQKILHAAADASSEKRMREYLRQLAELSRWGNYLDSTRLWVQHDPLPIHVQFGPLESFYDPRFGKKCSFQLTLGVQDAEATAKYTAMRDAFTREIGLIDQLLGYHPADVGKVTVEAIQAAIYGGVMAEKKFVGEAIPNHPDQQREWGARILLIPNQYIIRFRDIFRSIERHVGGRVADDLAGESYMRDLSLGGLVTTEEQAHFWIRMEGARDRLKNWYNLLNECVACMLPLAVAGVQYDDGRLSEEHFRSLLTAQLGTTLVKIDAGVFRGLEQLQDPLRAFTGKEHDARNLIIFGRLIRDGAVVLGADGTIVDIRPDVAADTLRATCQTYAIQYKTGTVESASKFASWDLKLILQSHQWKMIDWVARLETEEFHGQKSIEGRNAA